MKEDCRCSYCKAIVNEFFCISCKYNFNKCESFYETSEGAQLCPKCHPDNSFKAQGASQSTGHRTLSPQGI
jgi:hypothetical protein